MIKAIFATDLNGGLGKDGSLPWPHDKEDMIRFKEATINNIVIMGSKTWNDVKMPKPLPNRRCIVVTNQSKDLFKGAEVINTIDLIPAIAKSSNQTTWIIGGAQLIESCHSMIEEIQLTTFMDDFNCDIRLDMPKFLSEFSKTTEDYGRNKIFSTWAR